MCVFCHYHDRVDCWDRNLTLMVLEATVRGESVRQVELTQLIVLTPGVCVLKCRLTHALTSVLGSLALGLLAASIAYLVSSSK